MTPSKAEQILKEINTAGTPLNLEYERWKADPMTETICELMYNLSTPDKCAGKLANIPGTGEESACAMVGYTMGRGHSVTEMMELDLLEIQVPEEIDETFENNDNEQGE